MVAVCCNRVESAELFGIIEVFVDWRIIYDFKRVGFDWRYHFALKILSRGLECAKHSFFLCRSYRFWKVAGFLANASECLMPTGNLVFFVCHMPHILKLKKTLPNG